MFRKDKKNKQLNLLSNSFSMLNPSALKVYQDENHWHNQFRVQVVERIDEELFRHLFCQDNGAPNASIRVLVGMMILKETRSWSDAQLFENCQFNSLVRSALGIFNIDDPIPAPSTYYLLRSKMIEWEKEGNEGLMKQVFQHITQSQIMEFKVNGKKIRMDSKLLGSNIAWLNRYELIHETIRLALKDCKRCINQILSETDKQVLQEIKQETASSVTYRHNATELETKISRLGPVIYTIIMHFKDSSHKSLKILEQVFYENYEVIDEAIIPLYKQALQTGRIETPHDPESDYHKKGSYQAKGFSVNITETCDNDNLLNLITDAHVVPASVLDCNLMQPAIVATQELTSQPVETVHTDGGYYSKENFQHCKEENIDFILGKMPGQASRYDIYSFDGENLELIDTVTNNIIPATKVKPKKAETEPSWAFKDANNKKRTIKKHNVEVRLFSQQLRSLPKAELNIRANVESTIFQLGYHYRGNKSNYRGLIRHQFWALARCLWINLRRIMKYILELYPKNNGNTQVLIQNKNNTSFLLIFMNHIAFLLNILVFFENIISKDKKIALIMAS